MSSVKRFADPHWQGTNAFIGNSTNTLVSNRPSSFSAHPRSRSVSRRSKALGLCHVYSLRCCRGCCTEHVLSFLLPKKLRLSLRIEYRVVGYCGRSCPEKTGLPLASTCPQLISNPNLTLWLPTFYISCFRVT